MATSRKINRRRRNQKKSRRNRKNKMICVFKGGDDNFNDLKKNFKIDDTLQNMSTNNFVNYYIARFLNIALNTSNKLKNPIQPFNNLIIKDSVLWVIDMQYDFIDENIDEIEYDWLPAEKPRLIGPGGGGTFPVDQGKELIKEIITFINNKNNLFKKIVFTRDWHPPNHCSFKQDDKYPTNFPNHCEYNTLGAMFHHEIHKRLEYNNNENKFYYIDDKIKIESDIIFKGYHKNTDSFTAVKWNEKQNNIYPIQNRQNNSCCPDNNCFSETGGKKLKGELYKKSKDMIIKDGNDNIIFNENMDNFDTVLEEYNIPIESKNHYIIGLAGEFCVKDTAINLKGYFNQKGKLDNNVNVIQDYTRYVFVPAYLGFQRYLLDEVNMNNLKPSVLTKKSDYGEWLEINDDKPPSVKFSKEVFEVMPEDKTKSISLYLFKKDYIANTVKLYSLLELNELKNNNEYKNTNEFDYSIYHFASDHRILIKDYANMGIQLLTDDKYIKSVIKA